VSRSRPHRENCAARCEGPEAKGAEFAGEIIDRGFGLTTVLRVPGAGEVMIYQPHHPTAHDL